MRLSPTPNSLSCFKEQQKSQESSRLVKVWARIKNNLTPDPQAFVCVNTCGACTEFFKIQYNGSVQRFTPKC